MWGNRLPQTKKRNQSAPVRQQWFYLSKQKASGWDEIPVAKRSLGSKRDILPASAVAFTGAGNRTEKSAPSGKNGCEVHLFLTAEK